MDTPRQPGDHSDMVEVEGMTTVDGAPRLITVEEFDKMIAGDVFADGERVELVEGVLVSYAPPQGNEHAGLVWHLPEAIRARLGVRAAYWTQSPVIIAATTVLEPDLSILRMRSGGYRHQRPVAADVRAVVEIAVSSLRRDRSQKLRLYAEAGIPEYWVVDVAGLRIETFSRPAGAAYTEQRTVSGGDSVTFEAFPDVVFTADELFG
jgi:Uma2 family endonuclease